MCNLLQQEIMDVIYIYCKKYAKYCANRIILFFLEFVGINLEKINFLLRNFISLQRNQSVLIARSQRGASRE